MGSLFRGDLASVWSCSEEEALLGLRSRTWGSGVSSGAFPWSADSSSRFASGFAKALLAAELVELSES